MKQQNQRREQTKKELSLQMNNSNRSRIGSNDPSSTISRQDSEQQRLSEKQTLLEVSDLRLIEIESLWIISNNNSVPKAQIQFLCDLNEVNFNRIMEKYNSGQYKSHQFQTYDFYNTFYTNGEQKKMAIELFKQLSSEGSQMANLLHKIMQKDKNQDIKFTEKEDDIVQSLMHNLCLVVQGNLLEAFYTAFNNIMCFGFNHPPHGIPMIPKIGGMQILISLFDCFGQTQGQLMEDLLCKDLFFGQDNLLNFIYHYYSPVTHYQKNNDQQSLMNSKTYYSKHHETHDDKHEQRQNLICILDRMIEKVKEMKANGIRHSLFLYYELIKFYQKIHNKQTLLDDSENEILLVSELTPKEAEKLQQVIPTDLKKHREWITVKNAILHNEALTKKQEQIWFNSAFQELYYDAIQMLGEKSIISDQNTTIGLKCYHLLFLLGEKNSIHVLYSLLCYNGLYKDIMSILSPGQYNQSVLGKKADIAIMSIQCQIRHSKLKESLDELKEISKNRIEAYDLYLLAKCVFTQEEKDYIGALCIYTIMTNKSQSEFKLFDNLLMAKLLYRGGTYVQKNVLQSYTLLKILLRYGDLELMRDYLCKLFLKKNLEKISDEMTKEQKRAAKVMISNIFPKTQQKKKTDGHTVKNKKKKVSKEELEQASHILYTSNFYQEVVQFQSKDVKRNILMKIQIFKEKSQMQYISETLKQHYEDLVHIGYNILFPPDKHYSLGNLISNYDFFKRKNLLKISTISASSIPIDVQALKSLILKNQSVLKATQIFSLEEINYNILKYFYTKKTEEIRKEQENQNNSDANKSPNQRVRLQSEQNELQNSYFMRVQKQLEQIEEKSEHSIGPTYNKLSAQSIGDPKQMGPISQQRYQIQSDSYLQSNNDFQSNQQSKSQMQPTSGREKKSDQVGGSLGMMSIQQNEPYQEEGSQNPIQSEAQHSSTQMNEQAAQQDVRNNDSNYEGKNEERNNNMNNNKAEAKPVVNINDYFSMKLDNQYNISLSGKLMDDEILVFTNEDVVFTNNSNNQQQNTDNSNKSEGPQSQSYGFNGESGYGYFKFNSCQKFMIQKIPSVEKIFSDDFYPLIKRSSSFCLKFYGFYMNEQVWYVLSEIYDEQVSLDSDLTFSEINQLYQITLGLHLSEQCGLINYWGTSILYRKGGKLFLPNIITLIQLFHYDFATSNLISDISQTNESEVSQKKKKHSEQDTSIIRKNQYAPEVFIGNMDMQRAKCDIWAIGAILFETIFKKPLIQLIDNPNYIQEFAKLKNPFFLQTVLSREKEQYLQKSQTNSMQNLENESQQPPQKNKIVIPPDILDIYLKIIQMSIVYDPEIRCSSEEILSFIDQQFKMSSRMADKENYERFLEYQDNFVLDISSELERCKNTGIYESLFVIGNNQFVWLNYKESIVFYRDSYKNNYILYNPNINLSPLNLKETIKGEGILINTNNEIILGYFAKNCLPQNIDVIDTVQGNSLTKLSYDERGAPQSGSVEDLIQRGVLQQIKNVKMQQQEVSEGVFLKRLEESKNLNYLTLFQQFLTYWKSQKKMYEDLFGNKIIGYFDNNLSTMCVTENIPLIIENPREKTIYILNNQCIIIDHSTFSIQFFYPLELFNSADRTIGNYLHEIFCKDQPFNTTFMLSGLCYVGGFRESHFENGFLIFKDTNTLAIKYHPDPTIPYFTRINYNNVHFYEGYIFLGMYNGSGEYSNKKQVLYRGTFENNFLSQGQIFFDNHPTFHSYEGSVIYDQESHSYMMHGLGKCLLKNKTLFEGQFNRNEFNGKGKLTYKKNKGVYEGFFRDGQRDGPGIFKSKKITFEGEYRKGQKYNYGKQIRKNGKEIYEGEFKNDKRNGVGVLRYPYSTDIIFYQGTFLDDRMHGEGVEITRSRAKYLVKYYKDQCIRRKQVRLETEECLFHFEKEEEQNKLDNQYIQNLDGQVEKDQNQDYPIQYYNIQKDQYDQGGVINETVTQTDDYMEISDRLSPISKLQYNQVQNDSLFQSESKPKLPPQQQISSTFYSIF